MSAIRTRDDKTTLLVTEGDNGHFRTLRAITYKKILNKSNAILAAFLHLLETFGLECRAFACKNIPSAKKCGGGGALPPRFLRWGGGQAPPLPLPVRRLCNGFVSFGSLVVFFCSGLFCIFLLFMFGERRRVVVWRNLRMRALRKLPIKRFCINDSQYS